MSSRETARTPRQVFGAMLRYYRERAGLSRTELARQISKSVSLIQAIELGQRAATADVTEDLERVLPADGALTRLRDEIGDGLGYQAYPSWFQDWLASEREAKRLRWFEPMLVPGLLQTEDYARAVFRARFGITDEEIDEQVAARLKRQEILARSEPSSVVGNPGRVGAAAPGRWTACDARTGGPPDRSSPASARVDPGHFSQRGCHRGLWAGAFSIADFEEASTVGYQETACQGQFVDRREDVELSPIAGIRSFARHSRGRPRRRYWRKRRSHGHQQRDLAQGKLSAVATAGLH